MARFVVSQSNLYFTDENLNNLMEYLVNYNLMEEGEHLKVFQNNRLDLTRPDQAPYYGPDADILLNAANLEEAISIISKVVDLSNDGGWVSFDDNMVNETIFINKERVKFSKTI